MYITYVFLLHKSVSFLLLQTRLVNRKKRLKTTENEGGLRYTPLCDAYIITCAIKSCTNDVERIIVIIFQLHFYSQIKQLRANCFKW